MYNSVQDFITAYNREMEKREDMVITFDFLSIMFTLFLFETILGISSFAAALYLSFNGMMVLGIGQAVIVGIYIYWSVTTTINKKNRQWPPKISPCPNGFMEVMDTGRQQIVCHRVGVETPRDRDIFIPTGNNRDELCKQAMNENIYWDQC